MPCDRSQYRPDWKAFARALKESVGWVCEGCGARHGRRHPETRSVVVLTVAHLNHRPRDDRRENLRVWCQLCHNRHDARHRALNAIRTRAAKRGQLLMPFNGELAATGSTAARVVSDAPDVTLPGPVTPAESQRADSGGVSSQRRERREDLLACPKCGRHPDAHLPPWLDCPAPAPAATLPPARRDRISTPCLNHER